MRLCSHERNVSEVRGFTFRDAGLHSAPLRWLNHGGEALRAAGWAGPSLRPSRREEAARRKTGLSDFGDPGYREGLEVLCEALESEADLNLFGRIAMKGMIVESLSTRLRLLDWAAAHPEVRREKIVRPWVILGLPRTGTTLLSLLLGLDPIARPLLQWEASSPVPPPELATAAEDPRIAAAARRFEGMMELNPPIRAMHPMGATLPTECVTLFFLDLRSLSVETQALVPSYGRWLEQTDMRGAYAIHELALQVLQSRIPTGSWSLKTPNHLWALDLLREFHPEARLVWTHRDPAKVVASVASLNASMQRPFARHQDPLAIGEEWNRKLRLGVSRGMAYDEKQTDRSWCHHVLYAELMRDPIAAVHALYAHFGDEVHPLHARRMQAWMRDRPQETFGRHVYDPADFGFTDDGLRASYEDYCQRFSVPDESKEGSARSAQVRSGIA